MHTYLKRYMQHFDYPLFITFVGLCLFGLVMIYSASMVWAMNVYDYAPDHFYKRQLLNLGVSIPVFLLGAFIPYKHYRRKSMMGLMLLVMFTLLFGVHFIGDEVNGAKSWIVLGPLRLQPSELAKIIMILYFSAVFANKESKGTLNQLNESIYPPIAVLLLAFFSVFTEVDLGSAGIILFVTLSILLASGIKGKTFAKLFGVIFALIAVASPILYLIRDTFITEKRIERLEAFLHPFDYAQSSGFQIVNGYLAIGAGGLKGLGLGQSVQKLGYLPEPQTDFIMAIIAEELGLAGTLIVIGGIGFIVLRALSIAMKAKDTQARMIAAGIGSLIGFQTFINLGGLLGLIPLTGVPLPFISYGGTSVVLLSLAMGILINVAMFVKVENSRS
ncbi:FtsW/RodA/SpoVE family cell cycle protein [Paenisporosarcina cavernae]|uniref:Probable peptidoglycan glycosyltransferase FtsW n=1 Tax=Paenisporosarcina cavernae TaxID=2320858 RepID=A0A385YU78_9BACL|nr:FtsW/RodA/SpoVE family cell cycle protein [Paenisporosarcina cavernae]AYC29122.1 FtsW/RodA/SpoVE family cell cycle protein [Paenisporosarcina cavernae]